MSTARQKRKPVFDPSALDEELDDLWPARTSAAGRRRPRQLQNPSPRRRPRRPWLSARVRPRCHPLRRRPQG